MSTADVAVIDYGVGNLLSVRRGLEHCGATVVVTSDPEIILQTPRVVLPGVGAFANGMAELSKPGLDRVVRQVAESGKPLLGICLGMQMLMDESSEFGTTAGLGLIKGKAIAVPAIGTDGASHKIPHIGWNALVPPPKRNGWDSGLLQDIEPGDAVYFVHSFMASPLDPAHTIADCRYNGVRIAAVIGRGNVMGCQFHPEKSGEVGLKILRRFLTL